MTFVKTELRQVKWYMVFVEKGLAGEQVLYGFREIWRATSQVLYGVREN